MITLHKTMKSKTLIRIILITLAILLIPVFGMKYGSGWHWTLLDFIFAGTLIGGTQLAYEFISKRMAQSSNKIAVGLTLLGMFLLIWVNGAVGIIGYEGSMINAMYFAVIAIIFFGSIITRFKASSMAYILYAAATVQMLIPTIALILDRPEIRETPGVLGVFVLNAAFATLFVVSAILFRRASINLK